MICVATAKRKTKKKLAGGVGDCKSPLGFFGDLVVCVCVCGRVCVCTPVAYGGMVVLPMVVRCGAVLVVGGGTSSSVI